MSVASSQVDLLGRSIAIDVVRTTRFQRTQDRNQPIVSDPLFVANLAHELLFVAEGFEISYRTPGFFGDLLGSLAQLLGQTFGKAQKVFEQDTFVV